MAFWLYMLRCADQSYYVGHTENLEARVAAHQSGMVAGYTQKRRPLMLVYSEYFGTRIEALEQERRIKGWSRTKKEALIKGDRRQISALARKRWAKKSVRPE